MPFMTPVTSSRRNRSRKQWNQMTKAVTQKKMIIRPQKNSNRLPNILTLVTARGRAARAGHHCGAGVRKRADADPSCRMGEVPGIPCARLRAARSRPSPTGRHREAAVMTEDAIDPTIAKGGPPAPALGDLGGRPGRGRRGRRDQHRADRRRAARAELGRRHGVRAGERRQQHDRPCGPAHRHRGHGDHERQHPGDRPRDERGGGRHHRQRDARGAWSRSRSGWAP